MVDRISTPGKATKLVPLGPGVGRITPWIAMRKTIDDLPREPKR